MSGVAVGLGCAFALSRMMQKFLFGVSPTDTATLAGVALLFIVVSLAASYVPAQRAATIDLMSALRV